MPIIWSCFRNEYVCLFVGCGGAGGGNCVCVGGGGGGKGGGVGAECGAVRFRTNKAGLCPSRSSVGCSKVVPLLQFFFLCALVVSYVAFILSFITKTRQYSFDPFKPYL